MTIQKRSIPLCIILSVITCGIYALYWFVCITNDVNAVTNKSDTSGGMALLLTIVTCGIYGIYWAYQIGKKLDEAAALHGKQQKDQAVLFLILNIIGLAIVTYAIVQSSLNEYAPAE